MRIGTKVVMGKELPACKETRALAPPVYLAAVYTFENAQHGADLFSGEKEGYVYTRLQNPTLKYLEEKMAFLEGGEAACAFASGMAAISTTILALCDSGDNLIVSEPIYGGTFALLDKILPRWNIEVRWAKAADFVNDIKNNGLVDEHTKLILTESPANPTLDIVDLKTTAEFAHQYNIPVAVDTTFATFYMQRPIELGVDIVIYSTTKYIGGHSDSVGGMVVSSEALIEKIKYKTCVDLGGIMAPMTAYLFLRGLQTLVVRMDRHVENARKVAQYLEGKAEVQQVFYPGSKSHPQYELAQKQMRGPSAMMAFILKGGREAGKKFLDAMQLCQVAVSLGAVTTLIEHPASMTHSTYSAEDLAKAGIEAGLIRISVGIEDINDILEDLERGFAAIR
ncbi:PLP-dependent transferase [bacterium]|nr:PLP-dependent transferase [bacterium]